MRRGMTARLLFETGLMFGLLALLANYFGPLAGRSALHFFGYGVILFGQGLVLQRIYIIAHEAAHKKLAPSGPLNDVIGQAVLSTIFVPLHVYRSIHQFHHGFNRKNFSTSALDVFVSPWPVTWFVRMVYSGLWYLEVFAGGFFLHSLVSIVLFLLLPTRIAQKISPAFRHWGNRDRIIAWAEFLGSAAFQLGYAWALGFMAWVYTFGLPLLAFAWIYSLLVYIFHFRTTLGNGTRYNVRSVRVNHLTQWWLLNFNLHAAHHMYPQLAWYELPAQALDMPQQFAEKNLPAQSLWQAITNQFKGPTIIYAQDAAAADLLIDRD